MAEHDKVFDETALRNTYIEIPPAEKLRKERLWENIEKRPKMRER